MANTTQVPLLGGLANGSDLHELFKNAQLSSSPLHSREAQQWSVVALPFQESGVDSGFEARWRPEVALMLATFFGTAPGRE